MITRRLEAKKIRAAALDRKLIFPDIQMTIAETR